MDKAYSKYELMTRKEQILKKLDETEQIENQVYDKLVRLESELSSIQNNRLIHAIQPHAIKKSIRTFGAYVLNRRNRKNLYSKKYKSKQAENDLKKYRELIYTKGFTNVGLKELQNMFIQTNNKYLKRAIAWELLLWYANYNTPNAAEMALYHLPFALKGVTDQDEIRHKVIVGAECYRILGQYEQGKKLINSVLKVEKHPDLILALVNLTEVNKGRIDLINKVFESYKLTELNIPHQAKTLSYDDLQSVPQNFIRKTEHKVSIILPAYNSEVGIKTAIESILQQTWYHLELIIVDDCSTDKTVEVIKQYMKEDERIKLFSTKINSGPYVARNIGLRNATGEFVTINDADDWSHCEKIEIQVTHLIENNHVIANTSEQARMTEDFLFHRRGTRGKYLFTNLSSLMFRRNEVINRLGYWDRVRFAADGEFKRRLSLVFGKEAVIDLKTGPLSFQRQSDSSLTGSSAFGYNGFFMGARKFYFDSFRLYHEFCNHLYYDDIPSERQFPVPYPMLPERKKVKRNVDIIMMADFYQIKNKATNILKNEIKKNQALGLTTGLVQLHNYNFEKDKDFHKEIFKLINGRDVQMIVYGEEVHCQLVIIRNIRGLLQRQKYLPKIKTLNSMIIIDELIEKQYNKNDKVNLRRCLLQNMSYFDNKGIWYAMNQEVQQSLKDIHEVKYIHLKSDTWLKSQVQNDFLYEKRIAGWLVDK